MDQNGCIHEVVQMFSQIFYAGMGLQLCSIALSQFLLQAVKSDTRKLRQR
jgi:hypothetical protein